MSLPVCLLLVAQAALATPGAEVWVKRYNDPRNHRDEAFALGVSPDGSTVFVTGRSYGGFTTGIDYATVAYDASTGARLWAKRYNGPGNAVDEALALGVSPDGSAVFVTGRSYGGATTSYDYATVAYDASTGAKLWVRRYNGPANGDDVAFVLGVSPGSAVFVTGRGYGGATTSYVYATVAYDASTGAKLWAKRYNGPANGVDDARSLWVSPDGSVVFVTGGSDGGPTTGSDYATVAYDASTGAKLWVSRYNGKASSYDFAFALRVSPDGSMVFVTGYSYVGATSYDYATVAYDASTGAKLWVSRYNGPANGADFARALRVSPDGSMVFVTGYSDGGPTTGSDYATVAYDASTGAKLWVSRYNGPANGDDFAGALGVSPDGSSVFVTGESTGSTSGYDYATVAYDVSSGALLWSKRYKGPGNGIDEADALGVSHDSSTVFVTGRSYGGATTNYDYATVAYSAV